MSASTVRLRAASEDHRAYVEELLAGNDLPVADLDDALGSVSIAIVDETTIGVGGLERYGDDGLLRSVAIEADYRGQGFGAALVAALEDRASDRGLDRLFLLTTTAEPFFEAHGYERIPQADAPAEIQGSSEFSELCPDSATCMWKSL